MKKQNRKLFVASLGMLVAFVLWTVAVRTVDLQVIGPQGSAVGLGTVNAFVHALTGVRMSLYTITNWLGLVPFFFVIGFALLGLYQWIKRKTLKKVDRDILVLGGFYFVVMAVYLLFELFVVNYRPVLIDGRLEASYPSSTTLLVMCVMPTAVFQLKGRIKNLVFRRMVCLFLILFMAFMVIGRLVSGVHWFTDIVGGILLSGGLVMMYRSVSG